MLNQKVKGVLLANDRKYIGLDILFPVCVNMTIEEIHGIENALVYGDELVEVGADPDYFVPNLQYPFTSFDLLN